MHHAWVYMLQDHGNHVVLSCTAFSKSSILGVLRVSKPQNTL